MARRYRFAQDPVERLPVYVPSPAARLPNVVLKGGHRRPPARRDARGLDLGAFLQEARGEPQLLEHRQDRGRNGLAQHRTLARAVKGDHAQTGLQQR